jgi:class 3 adenylate cyclase
MTDQRVSQDATAPNAPAFHEENLGILFADVSGSTRLYEAQGDKRARELISHCIRLMTESAERNGGTLIKTIGDEVMCRFPGAGQAAQAALDMQEAVSGAAIGVGGVNLAIHVGFHYGPVVIEERDIFGDAVNLASRMVNLAKRDQVLTTAATVAVLPSNLAKCARQIDRAAVRGKKDLIDVYELVWQEAESTHVAGNVWVTPPQVAMAHSRLIVRMGENELEVSDTHPSLTVGRGDQNDLVIANHQASRLHARIDYRNGRYLLSDQSTNGSWVSEAGKEPRLVRHDTVDLAGSGTIAFGHLPAPGEPDLVRYALQT